MCIAWWCIINRPRTVPLVTQPVILTDVDPMGIFDVENWWASQPTDI